jgi:hypothetical protein
LTPHRWARRAAEVVTVSFETEPGHRVEERLVKLHRMAVAQRMDAIPS